MRQTAVHVETYNLMPSPASPQQPQALNLTVGLPLPRVSFALDGATVESYIKSVDDKTALHRSTGLVPPLAIAAIAKKKLMEVLHIPDGAIQSLAAFDFMNAVKLGEDLRCGGVISEHWVRGGVNYVAVDIHVDGKNRRRILKGTMGFILAPS